ncbi:glycosyltransferase family 39 protein [Clostridium sp. YIM B02515]|uniref:Glycosyltransferase family 39 protein n=1 Tax=Clostridium rhizosphaerae TaxID=2803861 RepID=A0ABS1T877_9CLOT|nr:glycosyltransferase family 39 protein [Clostridium rhizosphaerae]MBL4935544.1 glycosyltransferase family 39 protein [Clostridium rhizosphaerae]
MFSLKNESRKTKVILSVILAVFFAVTMFTIFHYGNSTLLGSVETYNNDDVKYIRSAFTLLSTGNLTYKAPSSPTVFIMPGLPYVLSFFMGIFGTWEGVTAFRVFQAILQTASLLLVFFIGRKAFNSRVALLAVLLNALYIPEVWVSNIIITETIFKFFFLMLIYFCLYAVEEKKLKYYILGGIFWGLSALFRPPIAAFPIVILIMWIKKKYKIGEIIKYTIVVSTIFVLIMSPWWLRNYRLYDKFIPFTASSGNPMLQGTYIHYNDKDGSDAYIDSSSFKYSDDEQENNKVETDIAKLRMKTLIPKEPFKYLYWYTIGKTFINWILPFYLKEILGINHVLAALYHFILLCLAVRGTIFHIRKTKENYSFYLILYSVIYTNCIYLPFYCYSRYMYPAMPLVILPASFMVFEIRQKMKIKNALKLGESA